MKKTRSIQHRESNEKLSFPGDVGGRFKLQVFTLGKAFLLNTAESLQNACQIEVARWPGSSIRIGFVGKICYNCVQTSFRACERSISNDLRTGDCSCQCISMPCFGVLLSSSLVVHWDKVHWNFSSIAYFEPVICAKTRTTCLTVSAFFHASSTQTEHLPPVIFCFSTLHQNKKRCLIFSVEATDVSIVKTFEVFGLSQRAP